jgi:hypothetical protein
LSGSREGKWLGAGQTSGGGTRGTGSRPQVPSSFSLYCSCVHNNRRSRMESQAACGSPG